MTGWRLIVASSAERTLSRLPEGVAAAIVEFMVGAVVETPTAVGKPLQRELEGYWSARRGAYRVVYRLDEEEQSVIVVWVEHRGDVYRRR